MVHCHTSKAKVLAMASISVTLMRGDSTVFYAAGSAYLLCYINKVPAICCSKRSSPNTKTNQDEQLFLSTVLELFSFSACKISTVMVQHACVCQVCWCLITLPCSMTV